MVETKDIKNCEPAKEKRTGGHKNRVYKTCDCGFVGYGHRQFPNNAKGLCRDCWGLRQEEKRRKARDLLHRTCKVCEKQMGSSDRRQVVCSTACRNIAISKPKVLVNCCVCGKEVERYESQAVKRDNFCCSLGCQRKHSLVDNRGAQKRNWHKHSIEAKKKWKKQQGDRRAQANEWWQACVKNTRTSFVSLLPDWQAKCNTASATLNQRAVVRREQEWKLSCLSWNATIKRQHNIAKMRMARIKLPNWERKCCSVARNIKHRLRD